MPVRARDHLATLKRWIEEGVSPIKMAGLSGAAQSYFLAQLLGTLDKPCLVLAPTRKEAERLSRELRFFLPEQKRPTYPAASRIYEFPPYDMTPMTGLSPHKQVVTRRLQALYALMNEKNPVIITSLDAIAVRTLPKEAFIEALDFLETGEEVERNRLLRKLEINGYRRCSLVEEWGDYSVRGGVVDLFSPWHPFPIRLEFWGDRLESIRRFDPSSQRSQSHLDDMVLLPATEFIMGEENLKRARSMGSRCQSTMTD